MEMEYAKFKELVPNTSLSQDDFNKVIDNSTAIIEDATNDFYVLNSIDDDLNSSDDFKRFKATMYLKAIARQVVFANWDGGDGSAQSINDGVADVQFGRTHLQKTSVPSDSTVGDTGLCFNAYHCLYRTGLLFAGVDHN